MSFYDIKPSTGARINLGHPLTSGLIHAWVPMGENPSPLKDLVGPWDLGTVLGDVGVHTGQPGYGLNFNGGSSIGETSGFTPVPPPFTIMVIAERDDVSGGANVFFDHSTGANNGYRLDSLGNDLRWTFGGVANYSTFQNVLVSSQPFCYAATMDVNGGDSQIYFTNFDTGEEVQAMSVNVGNISSLTTLDAVVLGRYSGGEYLDGKIYAVYWWDRELSAEEIESIFRRPWQIFEAQLLPLIVGATSVSGAPAALDINVSDAITLTESVSIANTNLGGISVSDNISLAESVTISIFIATLSIDVSDTIALTESVTIANTNLGGISVSDNITLSESVVMELNSFISVNDAVSIAENITIANTDLGGINVSDTVSLAESITIDISLIGISINVNDTVNIEDFVGYYDDQIFISEFINVAIVGAALAISVLDTITLAENISITNTDLGGISVSDNISLTEDITISVLEAGAISISISDDITLSESVVMELNSFINISDDIGLTEDVTVSIPTPGVFSISVNDIITLAENITVEIPNLGGISVSDDITLAEAIEMGLDNFVSISDDVTLSEDTTIEVPDLGDISVSDNVSIVESVTITNSNLGDISVLDNITITDSVTIETIRQIGPLKKLRSQQQNYPISMDDVRIF